MKLFPNETFLAYKTKLIGDVAFIMYWDLDSRGRPECIQQLIRIGKSDPLPLKTPLLIIRPPIIKGIYDKREFANIVQEEVGKKRIYLDRMGEKLRHQIETLILTNNISNKSSIKENSPDKLETFRRLLFLIKFIFGGDGGGEGEREKERPP